MQSAFGVLGFVKFLEGYYLILITKRRRVAVLGHHVIYKVEDTSMIYIPHEGVRVSHPDEAKYLKMFQSVDLSSNFYFSYSYDLTNSLQQNHTIPHYIEQSIKLKDSTHTAEASRGAQKLSEEAEDMFFDAVQSPDDSVPSFDNLMSTARRNSTSRTKERPKDEAVLAIRNEPNPKFIWNNYMLEPVKDILHSDWILHIVHGFAGQSNINIYGSSVYLTLIARRSSRYAGTRFLKRGANYQGDVANEVETEQIVNVVRNDWFSSIVQIRGSIPCHWSQDYSKMVPKPPISVDISDPLCQTSGAHFNQMFERFGTPVVVLNLVKQREKKIRESQLSVEYSASIKYLNQFLPPQHQIQYIGMDMARINKRKDASVMGRLADIAYNCLKETGIYFNKGTFDVRPHPFFKTLAERQKAGEKGVKQAGIIRVNCVDCLDRTNTAQFAIGKCALALQLYGLGCLYDPVLEYESECVRMLEELYEDHGDILALQYGGSQLVHRIQTYRRTAPWTSQGQDIMQTLSRYYSNTFSDADKQNAINLFLGIFQPDENSPPIWELQSDYLLHHKPEDRIKFLRRQSDKTLTQWWDPRLREVLPGSLEEKLKKPAVVEWLSADDIRADSFSEFYQVYSFVSLADTPGFTIACSVRDFTPGGTISASPFTVRAGRKLREVKGRTNVKNPSVSGQSSTASVSSTSSSTDTEGSTSSDDDDKSKESTSKHDSWEVNIKQVISFESLLAPMKQIYGMQIEPIPKKDQKLYSEYQKMAESSSAPVTGSAYKNTNFLKKKLKFFDTSYQVKPPTVTKKAQEIYRNFVQTGIDGPKEVSGKDLKLYKRYATTMPK